MRKNLLVLIAAMLMGSSLQALDKEHLAKHLLMALNESPSTRVEVGDPRPSDFGGLLEVPVRLNKKSQVVYMAPDEKKYIFGNVFDLTVNYDAERMKQFDLKKVYAQGSKKAPVTIVEFSDLQCGYCKKAHLAFEKELFQLYSKDQVRWIYKHFPLQNRPWSMDGAVAAQCAGEQGNDHFWSIMELLFENSKTITKENFAEKIEEFAKELKLNKKKLAKCQAGTAAREKVLANRQEGVMAGVRSTPTFFINGRMQRGFRNINGFKPLIDAKLEEAKKK